MLLRCQALDPSADVVGRAFSGAAVEMALAGYPGFHLTAPPGNGSPYGVYTAAYVPQTDAPHVAVLPDGTRVDVAPPSQTQPLEDVLADARALRRRSCERRRTDPAGAAGCGGPGPQRGQGRDGERRALDPHRRGLRVARRDAHPRARPRAAARGRRPARSPCTRCRTCGR